MVTEQGTEPAELTVIVYVALANWEALSVTCNVKLEVVVVVGVPEIVPELLRERPAGRSPEMRTHAYGAVPPVTGTVTEYEVPTVAPVNVEDVTDSELVGLPAVAAVIFTFKLPLPRVAVGVACTPFTKNVIVDPVATVVAVLSGIII